MWLTQRQVPIKPHVPVDVLTQLNELEAYSLFGDLSVLVAVANEMETRAARLRFYEEEKRQCIEFVARRHGLLSMAASSPVDLGTDYGNAVVGVREPEAYASATRASSVGDPITTPTLLTQVLPEYSEEARRAEYQGTVILETIVRRDGTVDVVRVARSLPFGLNEKAIEAVRQWRFRPGMRNGEPVDVEIKIEVNFNRRPAAQEPRVSEEEPSVESEIREWRETYLSTKNEYRRDLMRLCFNFPDLVRHPGFFFWPSDRFKDGCKNHYSPNRTLDDSEPRYFATKEGQVTRTYRRGGVVGSQNSRE